MKKFFVLIVCFWLTSCASTKNENIMHDAAEFSAVSVLNPDFQPLPGQSFAWYSPIIWSSAAMPRDPVMIKQMTDLINRELLQRGYKVVDDQRAADYVLGAAIVDGDSAQSDQLRSFFRLFPSLGNTGAHLAETTAMVGVINSKDASLLQTSTDSNLVLWRSSLAAYVVGDKISPELQNQRLEAFAHKLMRSLP